MDPRIDQEGQKEKQMEMIQLFLRFPRYFLYPRWETEIDQRMDQRCFHLQLSIPLPVRELGLREGVARMVVARRTNVVYVGRGLE